MKVAIYGAGVSGLACAYQLERLGFTGQIHLYEEKEDIGVGNLWME
ncbi:NAD(P)-binding protein [Ammoniphilus sp. YIM 78166]|nr:NAD(P)-binding protein [Ammoniphilus sp. YIM 78166]